MTKVLVADDHIATRRMIQVALEKNGYEVVSVNDGLQAWSLLSSKPSLQLAILDWDMPGLDGVEICTKMQEEHKSRLCHIILLTAKEGTENITNALKAGANDYITKPFNKDELLARLHVGERIIGLQTQLTQAQKLESIGQLASGIAHEINTPTQYVGDNLTFLEEGFEDMQKVLGKYTELIALCRDNHLYDSIINDIDRLCHEVDLEYLAQEIPNATRQSNEGVRRISEIVHAMKEYSHPGMKEKTKCDINKSIVNTITVARNKWKYVSDVKTDLDPDLPLVTCLPAEINQVILNLIVNAAEAIQEMVEDGSKEKGTITVSSRQDHDWVDIKVSDTGPGIPEAIHDKIYDPFFTTKQVGRGSGQGLMVSYSIVTEKHDGIISFETEAGKGTTFTIRLPIDPLPVQESAATGEPGNAT
ncbi:MAG: response regulator [Sedimentisphaerales bacterium]|nr:response regulator [Sedimentisphaerales bacterium]